MSPAVCGLFRPVILLPQSLVQKLPPAQLRAVLLHELTHLRRGDVWINCAQALVQIVYWWHPLLWLANARTRSVREEAVDDAVMLALRDDAEAYAPTLLEVAKLAFSRPLASLGLVGILESRSALRQRIERLVDFRAPRKAGLTIMSLLGICIFSAVALPMGEAITSADKQPVAQAAQSEQSLTVKVNPEIFIKNVKAKAATYLHAPTDEYGEILLDILRGEGVDCHPPHGLAFNNKTGEITTQNTTEALEIFRQVIEQLNRPDGQCNLLAIPIHRKGVLIQGEFYIMRTADFDELTEGLQLYDNPRFYDLPWWSVEPDQFAAFGDRVKSLGLRPFQRPRVQTSHGMTAQLYYGTETNSIELSCLPFVTVDQTQRFVALTVQVNTKGWFTDNPKGDWPVHDGTNRYAVSGQVSAEDHGGIVLRAKNPAGDNLVVVLGVQIVTNNPAPAENGENAPQRVANASANLDTRTFLITQNPGLANLRKKTGLTESSTPDEYLRGISKLLSPSGTTLPPTSIWLKENGLLLVRGTPQQLDAVEQTVLELNGFPSRKPQEGANSGTIMGKANSTPAETGHSTNLETRTFKVDPLTFYQGLKSIGGKFGSANPSGGGHGDGGFLVTINNQTANISLAAKQFFRALGLNLDPPKSVFFNDRLGVLFVRATEQDLDTVEKAMQVLNYMPTPYTPTPQIHIKARFIEVSPEIVKSLSGTFIPAGVTNVAGVLTGPDLRPVLHTLEQSKETETLAEPEVTTLSGRQTQMRATEIITIITNFTYRETSTNAAIVPQFGKVECGPVLDTIASVMPDGYTIDLRIIPSLTEFLGYDKSTNTIPTVTSTGAIVDVPTIRPSFCVRQADAHLKLWDGQTVVLGGLISTQIQTIKDTVPVSGSRSAETPQFRIQTTRTVKKQLLVLITATLVDPAGNRIHGDDEMLFARNSIPPQDSP